jgi:hypothetical protein
MASEISSSVMKPSVVKTHSSKSLKTKRAAKVIAQLSNLK